jgi:hypothetical protein
VRASEGSPWPSPPRPPPALQAAFEVDGRASRPSSSRRMRLRAAPRAGAAVCSRVPGAEDSVPSLRETRGQSLCHRLNSIRRFLFDPKTLKRRVTQGNLVDSPIVFQLTYVFVVSISKLISGTKPKRFDLVRFLSERKENVIICSKND